MTLQEFLAKAEALFSSAESNGTKIAALTNERDGLLAKVGALTTERDTALAEATKAKAEDSEFAGKVESERNAAESAKAESATLKAEVETLKATPTAQAAAVLAAVGHAPVTGASSQSNSNSAVEQPPAHLRGTALAKWFHSRNRGLSGKSPSGN